MENEEDANPAPAPAFPAATRRRMNEFMRSCRRLHDFIPTVDPAVIDAVLAVTPPPRVALFEAVRTWDEAFLRNHIVDAAAAGGGGIVGVGVEWGAVRQLRRALDDVPSFVAKGLGETVAILENVNDRRPIQALRINDAAHGADDDDDDDEVNIDARNAEVQAFRRFVTLLAQQEGGRTVQEIEFCLNWLGLPEEEMERLFQDVLPNHRTLQEVSVNVGELPTQYFRMLTETIPTTPTSSLSRLVVDSFLDPVVEAPAVEAVVDMLRRNAAIQTLVIRRGLRTEDCQRIFQALPHNTNLRVLDVAVEEVFADTLVGVEESSLERLTVRGSFSEGAVASLAGRLRTNTTLQELRLDDTAENRDNRNTHELLDLVRTYNYTLRTVEGSLGMFHDDPTVVEQFLEYTGRNDRIREALEALENPDPERRLVMTPDRLVQLLELASDVPTALYKIVKLHSPLIGRNQDLP